MCFFHFAHLYIFNCINALVFNIWSNFMSTVRQRHWRLHSLNSRSRRRRPVVRPRSRLRTFGGRSRQRWIKLRKRKERGNAAERTRWVLRFFMEGVVGFLKHAVYRSFAKGRLIYGVPKERFIYSIIRKNVKAVKYNQYEIYYTWFCCDIVRYCSLVRDEGLRLHTFHKRLN